MTEDNELAFRRKNCRLINEEPKAPEELGPIIGYAQEPLLSLFDACKPLVGIVNDILNYVSIAVETTPDHPADDLTSNESASIRLYTMEWNDDNASLYFILNRTLKTRDRNNLRPWSKYLKLFFTALVKIPCAQPQTVWRGVRQNISDAFPRGAEVIWWAFSSCTTTLTVLENELYLGSAGKRTLFSIEVFNAKNISAHSYFKTEDEILLLPGTYMEVRSQLNPTVDLYIIHLRQMLPKTMLLEPPFEGAHLYPTTESSRHRWYRKKKYFIPISLFTVACIVTAILGSILGTRSTVNISGIQSSKSIDGICASAQWSQSGVTVAGGKGPGLNLDQLYSPDGLFVEESGSIYVVDSGNNRIVKWDSWVFSGYTVAGGKEPGNSSDQLSYPVDVVVDRNGTMYISDFNNQRVQQWSQGTSSGRTILQNFVFTGIGQDDEGSLYTSDWTSNQVTKWRAGEAIGQVLAFGLNSPDRLYVDQNHSVYVADRDNHRVIKIVEGTTQDLVVAGGSQGEGADQLDSPRGVTVDQLGNIYVADTKNHRIMRWLPGATSGTLIAGGRGNGSISDQLNTPTDLQFDGYGNLYVADSYNDRVQKFIIDSSSC